MPPIVRRSPLLLLPAILSSGIGLPAIAIGSMILLTPPPSHPLGHPSVGWTLIAVGVVFLLFPFVYTLLLVLYSPYRPIAVAKVMVVHPSPRSASAQGQSGIGEYNQSQGQIEQGISDPDKSGQGHQKDLSYLDPGQGRNYQGQRRSNQVLSAQGQSNQGRPNVRSQHDPCQGQSNKGHPNVWSQRHPDQGRNYQGQGNKSTSDHGRQNGQSPGHSSQVHDLNDQSQGQRASGQDDRVKTNQGQNGAADQDKQSTDSRSTSSS